MGKKYKVRKKRSGSTTSIGDSFTWSRNAPDSSHFNEGTRPKPATGDGTRVASSNKPGRPSGGSAGQYISPVDGSGSVGSTQGPSASSKKGSRIKSIGKHRFNNYQSPSESGYPAVAQYLDTRGKFDPAFSKRDENTTGSVTAGRTISKVGDRNYAETAYLSGGKSFRGGSWDRTGRTFTPSRVSYTPKRSGAGTRVSPYTYSMEEIKSV